MHLLLSLFLWILMGAVCAYFAQIRGRDPIAWFAIGMLLGIIGLLILFFLPTLEQQVVPEEGLESEELASSKTALMPVALRNWHVIDRNQSQRGPISLILLQKLYNEGTIGLESLVWSEGMDGWQKLENQEELKKSVAK